MVFWTFISAFLLLILSTLLFILLNDIAEISKMKLLFLGGLLVINTVLFNEEGKKVSTPKRLRKSGSKSKSPERKTKRKFTYPKKD